MVILVCQVLPVNPALMVLQGDQAEVVQLVPQALTEIQVLLVNLFLEPMVNQVKMVFQVCGVQKDPLVPQAPMVRTVLTDNLVPKVIWVPLVFPANKVHEALEVKTLLVFKATKVLKGFQECVENLVLLVNQALKAFPVLQAKMLKTFLAFQALTVHPVLTARKVLPVREVLTVIEALLVLTVCLVTKVFQVKMLKMVNAVNEVRKDLKVHEVLTAMTALEVIQVNKVSEEIMVCPVPLVTLVNLAEVVTNVQSILTSFLLRVTSELKDSGVLLVMKVLKVNEVLTV